MCCDLSKILTALGGAILVGTLTWGFDQPQTAIAADQTKKTEAKESAKPVKALILTGVNNHKWKETTPVLEEILTNNGQIEVDVFDDPDHGILATDDVKKYDILVLNFNRGPNWDPKVQRGFLDFLESGKGVVVVHAANNAFPGWPEYEKIIGGAWRTGTFHPAYGPFLVEVKQPDHPIMDGIKRFETTDEKYSNLRDYPDTMNLLAYAMGPDSNKGTEQVVQPMIWTMKRDKGRVFHTALGHDVNAMKNPYFIQTLRRGSLWAAGRLD